MYNNQKIKNLRLEISTICQLKCPECPNANGKFKNTIGYGYLQFVNFKKVLDDNPSIRNIELSNYGEIFLNPDIDKIIEYSFLKKIKLYAVNGSNFNKVSDETLENLVKYKFREITISLDGCSQEIYSIYRQKGNYNIVIQNIEKLNYYKKKYKSRYPLINWQFVLFGHNMHQVEDARRIAKKLKMNFILKKNWDSSYSPLPGTPVSSGKKPGIIYSWASLIGYCSLFWLAPQVNWDGKLIGCCVNYWTGFGNIFDSSLNECINSSQYNEVKDLISGRGEIKSSIMCLKCCHYHKLSLFEKFLLKFMIFSGYSFYKLFHFLCIKYTWISSSIALKKANKFLKRLNEK